MDQSVEREAMKMELATHKITFLSFFSVSFFFSTSYSSLLLHDQQDYGVTHHTKLQIALLLTLPPFTTCSGFVILNT